MPLSQFKMRKKLWIQLFSHYNVLFFFKTTLWSEKAQNGAVAATLVQYYICQLPYDVDDDDDDDDDDDGVDDDDDDDDDEWRSGGCRLPMQ